MFHNLDNNGSLNNGGRNHVEFSFSFFLKNNTITNMVVWGTFFLTNTTKKLKKNGFLNIVFNNLWDFNRQLSLCVYV